MLFHSDFLYALFFFCFIALLIRACQWIHTLSHSKLLPSRRHNSESIHSRLKTRKHLVMSPHHRHLRLCPRFVLLFNCCIFKVSVYVGGLLLFLYYPMWGKNNWSIILVLHFFCSFFWILYIQEAFLYFWTQYFENGYCHKTIFIQASKIFSFKVKIF